MNLYLSDWKAKVWREKGTAKDHNHTALSVKHGGGGVMAWACMAVSGTGPLNFTDDLMYDDSTTINLEGYINILPTNIQENATRFIGKCFILHQDNDPKHPASSVKGVYKDKEKESLRLPKSISRFKSDWSWISPAEEERKDRNSPKQATIGIGCIKGWGKYFKGWDQESGDVYGSQTHCCDCAQGIYN